MLTVSQGERVDFEIYTSGNPPPSSDSITWSRNGIIMTFWVVEMHQLRELAVQVIMTFVLLPCRENIQYLPNQSTII